MALETENVIVSFTGLSAENHRLPAYSATESLYGLSRAITITTNYLFESRVRRRRFNPEGYRVDLVATQPGSFETVFQIIADPAYMIPAVSAGLGTSAIWELTKSVFSRATGGDATGPIQKLEATNVINAGDIVALTDAAEPALRQAHQVINIGALNINITTGDHSPVALNGATKNYINTNIESVEPRIRIVSVGSFNANTGYGRVFDYDEGRTIPFQIRKTLDPASISVLLESFNNYSRKRLVGTDDKSAVAMRFRTLEDADGKIKKLFPDAIRRTVEELD